MSHDRGCSCGRESYEYHDCPETYCTKRIMAVAKSEFAIPNAILDKFESDLRVTTESINDRQVGGEHYKTKYQHWDWAVDLGLGWLDGAATKYVCRWWKKNGLVDLDKSLHYVQKLRSIVSERPHFVCGHARLNMIGDMALFAEKTMEFCIANDLEREEMIFMWKIASWETPMDLEYCESLLRKIMINLQAYHHGQHSF